MENRPGAAMLDDPDADLEDVYPIDIEMGTIDIAKHEALKAETARLKKEVESWKEDAARFCRNADYHMSEAERLKKELDKERLKSFNDGAVVGERRAMQRVKAILKKEWNFTLSPECIAPASNQIVLSNIEAELDLGATKQDVSCAREHGSRCEKVSR